MEGGKEGLAKKRKGKRRESSVREIEEGREAG